MSILKQLLEPKLLRILKVLIAGRAQYFHLQKISSDAKVPLASTFRIVKKLVKIGLVKVIKVGKMKLYIFSGSKEAKEIQKILGDNL